MKGLLIGFNIQESVFPLGLSYIKKHTEKNHPDVNIELKEFAYGNRFTFDINKNIELQAIAYILTKNPDFVAFSTYIWSIEIIQNIAKAIKQSCKQSNKEIKIIIGGVEANQNSLTNDIDFIITGEGEIAFSKLINYLKGNIKLKEVPNLIYKNKTTHTIIKTKEEIIENLDTIPFPYKIKTYKNTTKNIINSKKQNKTKLKQYFVAIRIETSRGCPYSCKYCHYAKRKTRNFSINYLEENIPHLFNNYNFRNLTIIDANFNINTKRMKQILDLINEQTNIHSTPENKLSKNLNVNFEVKPELITEEQIKILESYPFQINLEMGLQSTNDKVLKTTTRPYNIKKIKETLKLLHNSKLKYNLDLMYGLPNDTFLSFLNSVKFILNYASRQNQIRAHHFMLLNNTDFYKENSLYNLSRLNNINSSMITNTNSQNPIELWRTKVFIDTINKELNVLYTK